MSTAPSPDRTAEDTSADRSLATATMRVDTHKLMAVLFAMCNPDRPSDAQQAAVTEPGTFTVGFGGRLGGHGSITLPDENRWRDALGWLRTNPAGEPYLRAVVAAVRAQDDDDSPWRHERAVELLWGKRNQRRSRARQTPKVAELVGLLLVAHLDLHAPVLGAAPPAKSGRAKSRARDGYGGTWSGTLLVRDPETRAIGLHPQLRRILDSGTSPYEMRPVTVFSLRIPGHHNPRGTVATRADHCVIRHAVLDLARLRQEAAFARGGNIQAITVDDFLRRFTPLDVDWIRKTRRMARYVDALQSDLDAGAIADVSLAEPINRQGRRPGSCELRLHISRDRHHRPTTPTATTAGPTPARRRLDDRRPSRAATATGTADSTGPPA